MKLLHRVHHVSGGEDVRLHLNPTKQCVRQKRQRQALGVHLLGKSFNIRAKKDTNETDHFGIQVP